MVLGWGGGCRLAYALQLAFIGRVFIIVIVVIANTIIRTITTIIVFRSPRSDNPFRRHRLPEVELLAGSLTYASRAECVSGKW